MPAYSIKELQQHIIPILTDVDRVCREHNIRCYICDGTMLGAVRHGGFIPWDDDIDVCMPRPDYERFMVHAKEWLPSHLEAICAENDEDYPFPFGKIQDNTTTLIERMHIDYMGGLYIDVFPIDGMPQSKLLQELQLWRYEYYKKVLYFLHRDPYKHGRGPSSWIPLLCRKLYSRTRLQQKIKRLMCKYDYEQMPMTVNFDDGHRGVMPKELYGAPTPIRFEGHEVMGVAHPHEYLSCTYGEYMVIPKQEHQRTHNFQYLDYHLPYREYSDNRTFIR